MRPSSVKREPERPLQKRGRGNPNMQFQRAGYSINPGGRRKHDKGAKERMGEVTSEVIEFWVATMRDKGEEMCHRMRASENIAWGFLGKPAQQVFAAHAHLDVSNEIPKNADELEKAAALYAAMIGATDADAGLYDRPILDLTPSRVLPAPDDHDDMEATPARLRKLTAEEAAEQRQRVRRPQTRERVRRSR